MRLLHTSDWHLGSRLHGHDRTDELFRQVERVCEIAEERKVDVLLVAGDIFECRNRAQTAHEVTKRLSQVLSPHIRRGLRVILLPGNHDDREHFRMMRELLELEHGCCERVRVVVKADIFEMAGVQFAALPYPTREQLERLGERSDATGATERNKHLSAILADLVRDMTAKLKPGMPAVFVTHINVEGVTAESGKEIGNYDQDINLALKALPHNVSYIALGHIHQQQRIESHPVPCYYSGSFDRMDFGERGEEKGVLLVDVSGAGSATVTPLPLNVTPFYDLLVSSSELDSIAETHAADREHAFVRLTVERTADDDSNSLSILRRAKEIFPRLVDGVRWAGEQAQSRAALAPLDAANHAQTVEDFVSERFAGEPDLLPGLLARARRLIQEVQDAPTKN